MKRLISSALLVAAVLPLSAFAASYSFSVTASNTLKNTSFISDTASGGGLAHGSAGTWGLSGASYTSLWNDINTGGKVVTGATLTLTGIYDWANETTDPKDALFVNILGGVVSGVSAQKVFDSAVSTADTAWPSQGSPFATGGSWNTALHGNGLAFTDASAGSLLSSTTAGSSSSTYAADGSVITKALTPASVTWSDPSGLVASNLVINFSAANLSILSSLIDFDASGATDPTVGLGFAAECHYYMTGATLSVTTGPKVPDSGSTLTLMGLGLGVLIGFRRSKK
jgi:hypothetical protein